jgi:hypothetical protein
MFEQYFGISSLAGPGTVLIRVTRGLHRCWKFMWLETLWRVLTVKAWKQTHRILITKIVG